MHVLNHSLPFICLILLTIADRSHMYFSMRNPVSNTLRAIQSHIALRFSCHPHRKSLLLTGLTGKPCHDRSVVKRYYISICMHALRFGKGSTEMRVSHGRRFISTRLNGDSHIHKPDKQ